MILTKESVLSFEQTKTTQPRFTYFQIAVNTKSFMTNPVNYYFQKFQYMIIRIKDRVQLSISSTRANCHKYYVAMKHR